MPTPFIKYYPVANGDQSLIVLKDKTTILVDCNIRELSKGETDPTAYDVKADLLSVLPKRGTTPYVDAFILTHGDCDHCRGFQTNFYQGDPKKYSESNRKAGEIFIDEMWFSPMIAEEHTNDDEEAYQREAERRLALHRAKSAERDLPGNRVRIVGYDGNKTYSDLNHLRAIPGTVVSTFNAKSQTEFSVFIHAPFQEHLVSAEKEKNSTSIVFQARFKASAISTTFACLAMFGGDADHYAWDVILEKTQKNGNDKTPTLALSWDLFLAPHHCSWTFFNDHSEDEPAEGPLAALNYKRTNAKVIGSCREVGEKTPPHQDAIDEYVKKVGKANFLHLATYKKQGKTPQPIVFEITAQGPMPPKQEEGTAKTTGGAALGAVNNPSTYGSQPL